MIASEIILHSQVKINDHRRVYGDALHGKEATVIHIIPDAKFPFGVRVRGLSEPLYFKADELEKTQ